MAAVTPEKEYLELPAEEIFRAALEDFKSTLTQPQRDSFSGKDLKYVKLKIVGIQHHQERLKAMMNFSRIRFYLEKFDEFDGLCRSTKIAGDNAAEASSFIWGPSGYILQIAQEDSNVLNVVLDAFQKFGRRIPDVKKYGDIIGDRQNMIKGIAFMYQDLLQFYKKMIKLLTGQGWKKTFHIDWRDYESPLFETLLESFDAHGKILESLLKVWEAEDSRETRETLLRGVAVAEDTNRRVNDHIMRANNGESVQLNTLEVVNDTNKRVNDHIMRSNECYQQINLLIRQYEENRTTMQCRALEAEQRRKDEQQEEVLKWLSTAGISQRTYHKSFTDAREDFPETGVWILKENKILNWMNEETIPTNSVLWLNGKKGAGKTILASIIVQKCMETPNFKTSYFYCREDDPSLNTAVAILKGLLRQLLLHNRDPLPSCHSKKLNSGEEVLTSIDTIRSLLELFCNRDMNQFIIIDGLDECNVAEVKPVVKFWMKVVEDCEKYKPGKVRVLFVSQEDGGEIKKLMQSADIFTLSPEQSQADIKHYITKQFRELQNEMELTDEETYQAKEKVLQRADGMFLYAVLTMSNLFEQPNINALKAELGAENIPSNLGEAYQKIIERLEQNSVPNQWIMAKKIFGLLAGAKRPLKWHELQAALSIDIGESGGVSMDYHGNRLRNDIRKTCGALVQVLKENRVEFIHSTTRRFIVQSKHLDERVIECDLTILTLKYLTLDCFSPDLNDEDIKHFIRSGYYAFQDYAISKWKYHVEKLIRITASLVAQSPDYERKVGDALSQFINFHRKSINAAAQEKPPSGSQRSRQRHTLLSAQASQASTQSFSPAPTQGSFSSPSPIQFPQQPQQGNDPADFCRAFCDVSLYPQLVELWTHVSKHQKGDYKERHKVSLPHLDAILEKIRTHIQELAASGARQRDPTNSETLARFYGDCHFKCQRVTCDYFHEGFDSKTALENHSNRHDRPFQCPVETCSMVPFGFSTNKDKDRHVRLYHPDESGQPAPFVAGAPEGRVTVTEAKWECDICHKKFTRQSIRKDHIDAHYGERRHACETCGKRFTRSYDRNRHRRTHVRRARA